MLAGPQLELPRPGDVRQQLGNFDGAGRERRDRAADGRDSLLTHGGEADGARRDRGRMAVLDPQHDLLPESGSWKTGVPVSRPSIGIMCARQYTAVPSSTRAVIV